MFKANVNLKMLILLLVVLIYSTISPSLKAESPVQQTDQLYELKQLPQEIKGVGTVQRYQTGKNLFVGINLNLEMLYIATVTGSGFTHPGYNVENEITKNIQSYYNQFQNNPYAQKFNQLSEKFVDIPPKKFPTQFTVEVLSYEQILSSDRESKVEMEKDLQCFCDETDSKQFWAKNLPKYNEMTANFITKFGFDYLGELADFFGVTMSKDKFEIVLSPLNNGGTAVPVKNPDKTMTYYSIVNPFLGDVSVINVIIHENAHNYLYPVLNKKHKLITQYQKYLKQSFGKAQGFVNNDYESFFNEFLAMVITISIVDKYQGTDLACKIWLKEKMNGWDNLDEVCALIKNKYLAQWDQYPTFEDFLPVILKYFKTKSSGRTFEIGPKVLELPPIVTFKNAHIKDILLHGSEKIPVFCSKVRGYHFIISIADWIDGQDYNQFSEFVQKAGFNFEIIDMDSGSIVCKVDERNYFMSMSEANGVLQGYAVKLRKEQTDQLQEGKKYTIRPVNITDTYQWLNDSGVSFVWRKLENSPDLSDNNIKEVKVLGAYWENDPYIKGLKPNKDHSFFIETNLDKNSSATFSVETFFTEAGSEFVLFMDGKPSITARIYQGRAHIIP